MKEEWTETDEELIQVLDISARLVRSRGTIPSNRENHSGSPMGEFEYSDEEMSWRPYALCRGLDSNIFFPERGASMLSAFQVCHGCPVRIECLTAAIEVGDNLGVRGGHTPEERRRIKAAVKGGEEYEEASQSFYDKRYKQLLKARARLHFLAKSGSTAG